MKNTAETPYSRRPSFIQDCISKKVIRNTGQLPQYLIQNCHQGIVSRLDYGTKYCHNSPTLDEEPLQRAILTAINEAIEYYNLSKLHL